MAEKEQPIETINDADKNRRRIHAVQNNPGMAHADADAFLFNNQERIEKIHSITPQFSGGIERYVFDYTGKAPI